jgi:hypothetical protein
VDAVWHPARMMEALANLAGVLVAGALLGLEVWVAAIGILAWVVARPGPVTTRTLVIAGLLLGTSAGAYVAIAVLVAVLLSSGH